MISIANKESCCGCGACAQICPKGCITMTADAEGFLYPVVQSSHCVDCGACVRTCPISSPISYKTDSVEAFAAMSLDDDTRQRSSSGGIFSELAQHVLNTGGVVFGAAFAEDFSVHHVMISRADQLTQLRGSKYLQSATEDTFREVRTLLEDGREVLYTGVACQIAGLKQYLRRDYPNLYTVDVLCHGVPSPKVWRIYLGHLSALHDSAVQCVDFRCKDTGWKHFSMKICFENGKTYSNPLSEDAFLRLFLENICLRPSCHSCQFKQFPRPSDITIGDAWGIGSIFPNLDDNKGTSLIMVNSQKGHSLLNQIQNHLVLQAGDLDVLLPPSADSRIPVPPHPRRQQLFRAVAKDGSIQQLQSILKGTPVQRAMGFAARLIRRRR